MSLFPSCRPFAIAASVVVTMLFAAVTNADGGVERPAPGILMSFDGQPGKAAVVLAHDWFGDSEFYREFARGLAAQGYWVIASDLYGGKPGARDHTAAWALLKELTADHAAAVLDSGIERARQRSEKVVVIGFSAGAPPVLESAIRRADHVAAVVIFYGDTIKDVERLSRIKARALAIYGSRDPSYGDVSAADDAAQFMKAADQAGLRADVHLYSGADHAFAQPLYNAGRTYDPKAAQAAWRLTLDFLAEL